MSTEPSGALASKLVLNVVDPVLLAGLGYPTRCAGSPGSEDERIELTGHLSYCALQVEVDGVVEDRAVRLGAVGDQVVPSTLRSPSAVAVVLNFSPTFVWSSGSKCGRTGQKPFGTGSVVSSCSSRSRVPTLREVTRDLQRCRRGRDRRASSSCRSSRRDSMHVRRTVASGRRARRGCGLRREGLGVTDSEHVRELRACPCGVGHREQTVAERRDVQVFGVHPHPRLAADSGRFVDPNVISCGSRSSAASAKTIWARGPGTDVLRRRCIEEVDAERLRCRVRELDFVFLRRPLI